MQPAVLYAATRRRRASANWFASSSYDTLSHVADFNNDRYAMPLMGSELVTNGDFSAGTTGWTLNFNGTISDAGGKIRVTADGGASSPRAVAPLAGLTIGKLYQVQWTPSGQSGNPNYIVDITLLATGATGGAVSTLSVVASTTAQQTQFFTATQTTHYVSLRCGGTTLGNYNEWDNVSVKEITLTPTGRTYGSELVVNGDFTNEPTYGAELLDNGTFTTGGVADPSLGWLLKTPAVGTETMTISGGTLNLTGDGTNFAYADQSFTTVIGETYEVSFTQAGASSFPVNISATQGGVVIKQFWPNTIGTYSFTFVATSTTTWIRPNKQVATLSTFDNVSIKLFTQPVGWVLKTVIAGFEQNTISGGTLNLTGDGTNAAYADQSFTTVASQVYEVSFSHNSAQISCQVGTSQGGTQFFAFATSSTATSTTVKFVATGTTTWIRFTKTAAVLATADNVSIRALTAIGTYPKREATFDEFFAYTAASDIARTYTDSLGVLRNMSYGRTNLLRNSSTTGAVAGTPGTYPSIWGTESAGSEITRSIVGVGVEDGLDYIEFRFTGTATAARTQSIRFDGYITGTLAPNTSVAGSFYYRFLPGAVGLAAASMVGNGHNAGAYVNTPISLALNINNTSALVRAERVVTTSASAVNQIVFMLSVTTIASGPFDFSIRVAAPQFEWAAAASPYTRTTGTALTGGVNARRMTYANAKRQLRLENAGTNICLYSEETDHATWTRSNLSGTANQIVAPDGATTADLLTAISIAAQRVLQQNITYTTATAYCMSAYLKAGTCSRVQFSFGSAAFSGVGYVNFDLSGAGSVSSSGGTFTSAGITSVGNGWYRAYLVATSTASIASNINIYPLENGAELRGPLQSTPFVGSFYVWGTQVEASAFPTDYIKTTTAAVTRAIETARFSPAVEAVLALAQGSVVVRAQKMEATPSPRIIGVGNGGLNWASTLDQITVRSATNTTIASVAGLSSVANRAWAASMGYDASGQTVAADGGSPNSTITAGFPARTTVQLGRTDTVDLSTRGYAHSYYDFVGFSPERLPATNLQALAVAAT